MKYIIVFILILIILGGFFKVHWALVILEPIIGLGLFILIYVVIPRIISDWGKKW